MNFDVFDFFNFYLNFELLLFVFSSHVASRLPQKCWFWDPATVGMGAVRSVVVSCGFRMVLVQCRNVGLRPIPSVSIRMACTMRQMGKNGCIPGEFLTSDVFPTQVAKIVNTVVGCFGHGHFTKLVAFKIFQVKREQGVQSFAQDTMSCLGLWQA